jgi:peptide/nickel transport system ATP-binding protein
MDKVNTSILLITHDLAVASQVADRVIVMYAGEFAEDSEIHELFSRPLHPYTGGLLNCILFDTKDGSSLSPIHGSVPDMRNLPPGCRFAPRCPHAFERCQSNRPSPVTKENDHKVSCFLYDK